MLTQLEPDDQAEFCGHKEGPSDGNSSIGDGGVDWPDVVHSAQQYKRKKETSSVDGVSPLTLKAQPPQKRQAGVGRRLAFSESADGIQL